jgi:hypothetical protein
VKSIKKDVVVCKYNSMQTLKRYCEIDDYKNLSLDSYMELYKFYDYNTIEMIAIKDSCCSDISILDAPYIYQEDNKLYADVKYLNLKKDTIYYLVCSEVYSALDYTPHRKIPFTLNDDIIDLKNYYLGTTKDNHYLFWIENSDYLKISKPYLFTYNTNEKYMDLNMAQSKNIYNNMNQLKREFILNFGNKTVIDDLFDYVLSMNPAEKNIKNLLISEAINHFESSLYVSNTMTPLFELMKIIYGGNGLKAFFKININKKTKTVKIENDNKNSYICAIHYDNEECYRIEDIDNIIEYGNSDGYTLICLISDNMIYSSDFILIENKTNRYMATPDILNIVNEVGDK